MLNDVKDIFKGIVAIYICVFGGFLIIGAIQHHIFDDDIEFRSTYFFQEKYKKQKYPDGNHSLWPSKKTVAADQTVDDCAKKEFGIEIEQCTDEVIQTKIDALKKSQSNSKQLNAWVANVDEACQSEADSLGYDREMGQAWPVAYGRCVEKHLDAKLN